MHGCLPACVQRLQGAHPPYVAPNCNVATMEQASIHPQGGLHLSVEMQDRP